MLFLSVSNDPRRGRMLVPRLVFIVLVLALVPPVFAGGSRESSGGQQTGGDSQAAASEVVHVYSHRHYDVDRQLYRLFEEQTGIEVRVVEAGADELIQRLEAEGAATPADLLITVDAGRLYRAKSRGLLQSIDDPQLNRTVPAHLHDPDGTWYGLTIRSRIIAYHKDRVTPEELSTYEALAEPKFRGRLAIRSSNNIYNTSLLASLVAHVGSEQAESWAAGMVRSMARPPSGNDRDQLRAVAAGQADLAVVNTYYVALMATSSEATDREVAEQIGVFFPNQPDGGRRAGGGAAGGVAAPGTAVGASTAVGAAAPGTAQSAVAAHGSSQRPLRERGAHINVSGGGVTTHADNVAGATQLLRFLVSREAQVRFAAANYEYPVRDDVEPAPEVAAWGAFVMDDLPLSVLGENAREATMIFDRVGWR